MQGEEGGEETGEGCAEVLRAAGSARGRRGDGGEEMSVLMRESRRGSSCRTHRSFLDLFALLSCPT